MIKINIFVCVIYLSFLSCTGESDYKNRFSLEPANEITIKIGPSSRNLSFCIQYFALNDSNFLAIANNKFNNIEVYNLDTRKLFKVVNVRREGNNALFAFSGFIMHNIDTFIVFSPMPRLIGIINGNGEVLKKISYDKDISGKILMSTLAMGNTRPFLINNTLFFNQQYRANESFGILTSTKQKHSNVNICVNLISGECKSSPLNYPTELIGKDVSGMEVCKVLGYNDCFVYHFGVIDGLFVTKDHLIFEKTPINTNYKFNLPDNHWKYMSDMNAGMRYDLLHDAVQNIYYDSYRECYYIVVRQRYDNLDKNPDFGTKFLYPHCFIIILDKYLKYMGDVFFPDDTYSFKMVFISPEGLYISEDHVNNQTFNEDYMRFRLFKLKKL